jgi:hypothetical protein
MIYVMMITFLREKVKLTLYRARQTPKATGG